MKSNSNRKELKSIIFYCTLIMLKDTQDMVIIIIALLYQNNEHGNTPTHDAVYSDSRPYFRSRDCPDLN